MRGVVEDLDDSADVLSKLSEDRKARAQERRKKDGQSAATTVQGILPYLDFGEVYELIMTLKSHLDPSANEAISVISSRIPRIIAIRNRVAHTRPMEIDDSAFLIDAVELVEPHSKHWPLATESIARLRKDPSYVLGLTIRLPKDVDRGPQHNLPVPDFDETGFFGRQDQLRQIKKAIKGPYPVVSILGDGGIGKTSIALRAAYDLIDDPEMNFDTIVWVTAKSTILSTNEIQRIQGAIEDSLGLFDQAASILAGESGGDSEQEILSYLETFRVLLILDNLETVLDEKLRRFLLELPMGSKVLITSRIGVGSAEYPVHLSPLGTDDASRLLRALARVRGIRQLQELPQDLVNRWVDSMNGHPAYIRWFVAGVQTGLRPEDLLSNNALLLEFCMSNVYEYLGGQARGVVRSMQVMPGGRSQAELAYLNDYSADQIQASLLELLTTNFVSMSNLSTGVSPETVYQLSDFAKKYLDKHHAVSPADRRVFLERKEALSILGTGLVAESRATPYDPNTVSVRGPGDFHVAKILREALTLSGQRERALELCSEAQKLAPTFSEAWRIEGHIRSLDNNDNAALTAYERSVELDPDSASTNFHYGDFLVSVIGDSTTGLRFLQTAAKLDGASLDVLKSIVWAHYLSGNFSDSAEMAAHIVWSEKCTFVEKATAFSLYLRSRVSEILRCNDVEDFEGAVEALEAVVEFTEELDDPEVVAGSADYILFLSELAREIGASSSGYVQSKALQFVGRLGNISEDSIEPVRKIGKVQSLKKDKGYIFIREGKNDYFAHVREFSSVEDWERIDVGSICCFSEDPDSSRGLRAKSAALLEV